MVLSISDKAQFNSQLEEAGDKLVVVDFFATWCGPCKMIAPKLEALATEYKDEVVFLKVDVDENEETAVEYSISAMPTFVFFKKGKKIEDFAGANYDKLVELIKKNK